MENVQFQVGFEIVACVLVLVGVIVWFTRLEGRVNRLEERNHDLETRLSEMRTKHEKEIEDAVHNGRENNKVVWEKIDSLGKMITSVLQSLGRLEGKIESK